jgi:hypothetical protein
MDAVAAAFTRPDASLLAGRTSGRQPDLLAGRVASGTRTANVELPEVGTDARGCLTESAASSPLADLLGV